jgi:hypothetical protein
MNLLWRKFKNHKKAAKWAPQYFESFITFFGTTLVHSNSRRESMFIVDVLQSFFNPEGILC